MTVLCSAQCRPDQPREAAPGYRLCWACRSWLGRNLVDLQDLAPELEASLSRTNVVGEERVGGTPGRGQELNDRVASVRWQIHHDMTTTVRLVMHERYLMLPPASDILAMAVWLGRHVDWLSAHPSAGERADEAAGWTSAARSAINPNPPKIVPIGPCIRPRCAGELTAVVRPQDSLLPSSIVCSWWHGLTEEKRLDLLEDGSEAHVWTADQWHGLGRQMRKRVAV